MFYAFVVSILFPIFKLCFRLRIFGKENFPKKGAVIVASNHASFLDPIIIGISAPRKLNFIAREGLFRFWLFAKILRMLHAFPIRRESGDIGAFKLFLSKLLHDRAVLIFPEGTRSRDGALQNPRHGIGFLQDRSKAAILPCYVKGSIDVLPRHAVFPRFRPVSVYFGKVLDLDGNFSGDKKAQYVYVARRTMQAIDDLRKNAD